MRRMVGMEKKIDLKALRKGKLTEKDFVKVSAFHAECCRIQMHIVDSTSPGIAEVCATIRRMVRKFGIKLVIVDYLQKVSPTVKHEKRTYEVAEVSSKLKAVAAKTGVAMLALAQLTRESEKDKRPPRLSDLGDSSQIEKDGDVIALLHRDRGGENAHDASLIVAKQRDGETGCVKIHFDGKYCKFTGARAEDYE